MKKVFIANHCSHNKGDNGVLSNLLKLFKVTQSVDITVSSSSGKSPFWTSVDTIAWPGGKIFKEPNNNFMEKFFRRLNFLIQRKVLYPILINIYARCANDSIHRLVAKSIYPNFSKKIEECELVVCTGGHHLSNVLEKDALNPQLISLIISDIFQKPITMWAQTIGPFEGASKISMLAISKLLHSCNKIFIRDDSSEIVLKGLGVVNYTRSPDSVFLANGQYEKPNRRDSDSKIVTIAVYTAGITDEEYLERYRSAWGNIIKYLLKTGYSIQLLPMQYKGYGGDERGFLYKLCKEFDIGVEVLDSDLSPDNTVEVFLKSDLIIGHKTHAILYALALEIPVIAISYHSKTNSFMRDFGFDAYTFPDVIDYHNEICNMISDELFETQLSIYNKGKSRDCKKILLGNFKSIWKYDLADSSTKCNKDQPVEVAEDVWHHGRFNRQVEVAQCTNTTAEKNDTRSKAL